MKKISRIICNFFKSIWLFFDKWVIMPITKFFVSIYEFFCSSGNGLEKILVNRQSLVVISLIFALITFYVIDQKHVTLIDNSAEVLYNQKVTANYNEALYVVEGIPETVDVTLVGRRWDVYLAKQLQTNDITVDLTGLEPGVHKVNLKYKKALSSVEYKLDPSVATIVIYEKVSEEKEVNYEVINKDKIDSKLMVEDVTLSAERVYVKGNEATVNKVASVKALIDLENLVNPEVGEQQLKDVKLVAYDSNGKTVDVEIVPSKIDATVKITSPQKEVPIRVIPNNYDKIVFGKAISNITPDVTSVTIYGESSRLEDITYIPVYVDVSGLNEDKEFSITIQRPSGVRAISETSVNVKVTLGDETTDEVDDVYLEYENLGEGLSAQTVGENSNRVTISVKGVQSVLSGLDPTTIKAYIDLKGLGVGEHEVPVQVTGSDARVKYSSQTTRITVRITERN